jgi:hypothetical protein
VHAAVRLTKTLPASPPGAAAAGAFDLDTAMLASVCAACPSRW